MIEDPIVEEVRRHRGAIAAQFNNDLDAIVDHLRNRERTSGHKVLQPPKRKVRPGIRRPGSNALGLEPTLRPRGRAKKAE